MAHPNLTNRADRKSLAMGATAALLAMPLATAAAASPLDEAGETVDQTVDDTSGALEDTSGTEATEPSSVSPSSQPTRDVPDAVDDIVDGVLSEGGAVTPPEPPVEQPAPVPDAEELIEAAPAPEAPSVSDTVEDAVPGAAQGPVNEATEAVPTPGDPVEADPVAGGDAADRAPQATQDQSVAPRTPDRLVAAGTPPFAASSTRATAPRPHTAFSASTSTLSRTPTTTPLLSTPLAADLGELADDIVSSRTPLTASSEASATPLTGGPQTSPDAPTWLLASAGGLVLLLTAGHLLHARQRSPYTVAH